MTRSTRLEELPIVIGNSTAIWLQLKSKFKYQPSLDVLTNVFFRRIIPNLLIDESQILPSGSVVIFRSGVFSMVTFHSFPNFPYVFFLIQRC